MPNALKISLRWRIVLTGNNKVPPLNKFRLLLNCLYMASNYMFIKKNNLITFILFIILSLLSSTIPQLFKFLLFSLFN